mmetsp:Transcript_7389/g.32868  ORF Transcript_7389/g.32868 Transcript_7389/m.32868 type:complete len:114 (-) Transcript_7389:2561-2902(-)
MRVLLMSVMTFVMLHEQKWTKNCEELLTRIRKLTAAPRTSPQRPTGQTTVAKPAMGRPRQPSKAELRNFQSRKALAVRRMLGAYLDFRSSFHLRAHSHKPFSLLTTYSAKWEC